MLETRETTSVLRIEGIHYKTGRPVSLGIINGKIGEISEMLSISDEANNTIISPGFIDNQINGYANVDFSGNGLTVEGIIKATGAILKDGVTSYMPTLITNSHENLINNFKILDEACRKDKTVGDCIPGFHLEGPYISPEPGFSGCHSVEHIRNSSWKEFMEYQRASGGRIIQVTLAPEIEGAIGFIRNCSNEGIIVAIGHSNANAEQINIAVENGASLSTHLGNGCANLIHRHNNPIWPQLANDGLIPSIIADGNHLLPEEIIVFLRTKGTDRIILTSDVIYLAGMSPGIYTFSGMEVILKENGMLLNSKLNCLAGASFPLKKGVENIMKFTGIDLANAIKMATENVARIYKLDDRGTIEVGKSADIITLGVKENNFEIKKVYKGGISVLE